MNFMFFLHFNGGDKGGGGGGGGGGEGELCCQLPTLGKDSMHTWSLFGPNIGSKLHFAATKLLV